MAGVCKTLSDAQRAEVETLAAVLTAAQMADYFGIGRTTLFAMMEREPDIAERYKKGKARAIGAIAQSLIAKARGGDTASMIFYLKTQAGWRETAQLEVSGPAPATGAKEQVRRFLEGHATRVGDGPPTTPALAPARRKAPSS